MHLANYKLGAFILQAVVCDWGHLSQTLSSVKRLSEIHSPTRSVE